MASKQEDNFDLYDDPYVATGGNGGSDPYAEDEDDYYSSDRGRGHEDSMRKDDRPRYQSGRDEPEIKSKHENDGHGSYDHAQGHQRQQYSSTDSSHGASSTAGYDPAQPYHQRDSQYQQNYQKTSDQYSRQSSQGAHGTEGSSYNQEPRHLQQQQQSQQQSSSGTGREHG
ncbi:hypothetical protein BGX28_000401, partial [Mortierella sp. GBA30]